MAEEMKSETKIVDVSVNGETGLITVIAQTTTTKGKASWTGPKRQYGVDAQYFHLQHGGDIENFKKWVMEAHRQYTGHHQDLTEKLTKLKGSVIG